MNARGIETLTNPDPRGHIVYPYAQDSQVADAVALFTRAGLRKSEAVLLVMSETHRQLVRQRLEREGVDIEQLESTGQLVFEDAERLLATFMIDGIVDQARFNAKIGGMIESAKGSGGSPRPVRVFGEMVDLIWTSNPTATQHLERLWNEVIHQHAVPLLCAYSLAGDRPSELTPALVECHTHTVA